MIMDNSIKLNKYLPIAVLYFFFNSIFLPLGLLYTTILTPIFLIWLYRQNHWKSILIFLICTIPIICIHLIQGVNIGFYLRSYVLMITCLVFIFTFSQFLRACHSLRDIFRKLLWINFFLVIIACVAFFIPNAKDLFWTVSHVSEGLENFPRLRLFTYEPMPRWSCVWSASRLSCHFHWA